MRGTLAFDGLAGVEGFVCVWLGAGQLTTADVFVRYVRCDITTLGSKTGWLLTRTDGDGQPACDVAPLGSSAFDASADVLTCCVLCVVWCMLCCVLCCAGHE